MPYMGVLFSQVQCEGYQPSKRNYMFFYQGGPP
jgi:hypothetical protein